MDFYSWKHENKPNIDDTLWVYVGIIYSIGIYVNRMIFQQTFVMICIIYIFYSK